MENNNESSDLAITIKNFVSFLLIIWCKRNNKMKPSKMLRLSRRRDTDNRRLIEYFTRKCFFCFQALNPIVFFSLFVLYFFLSHLIFQRNGITFTRHQIFLENDILSPLSQISVALFRKTASKRFARFSKTSISTQDSGLRIWWVLHQNEVL